jgi:hypothetical protein
VPKKSTNTNEAGEPSAKPGDRLFTSLPSEDFAALWRRLKSKAPLPDSELLRQAMIRLDDEVTQRGELVIRIVSVGRA